MGWTYSRIPAGLAGGYWQLEPDAEIIYKAACCYAK
jgi:dTDP-4-dehydrorhamnose 3,5-epimerase-like enzyme